LKELQGFEVDKSVNFHQIVMGKKFVKKNSKYAIDRTFHSDQERFLWIFSYLSILMPFWHSENCLILDKIHFFTPHQKLAVKKIFTEKKICVWLWARTRDLSDERR